MGDNGRGGVKRLFTMVINHNLPYNHKFRVIKWYLNSDAPFDIIEKCYDSETKLMQKMYELKQLREEQNALAALKGDPIQTSETFVIIRN
jgi:hypothetical protein